MAASTSSTFMPLSSYETANVYLASFLRSQGATLLGFERVGKRRVLFRFAADEKLHDLVRWYWGAAPVAIVPLALFGSLRRLKSMVRRRPAPTPGTALALPAPGSPPVQASVVPPGESFPARL